jgi:hypothetical protein
MLTRMRFTIEVDDALLDGLRPIDPAVWVEDGDSEDGDWRSPGELLIVDAELQLACSVSKEYLKERDPLLARAIASFLDQAAMQVTRG